MTVWSNGATVDVGLLETIFLNGDPRTAQEQANDRYAHGGGWHSMKSFELEGTADSTFALKFPGDTPLPERSRTEFHDQLLVLFPYSFVAIVDGDNKLIDVSRMD